MTATATYSRLHNAFQTAAASADVTLTPFDVRVLVAILDRGGSATSDEIEADLLIDGSSIRRTLGRLYDTNLATGIAVDGGRRRIGIRTRVQITDRGRQIAALTEVPS